MLVCWLCDLVKCTVQMQEDVITYCGDGRCHPLRTQNLNYVFIKPTFNVPLPVHQAAVMKVMAHSFWIVSELSAQSACPSSSMWNTDVSTLKKKILQPEIVCTIKKNDEVIAFEKKLDTLGEERTVEEDDDLMYESFWKPVATHEVSVPYKTSPAWDRFFSEYLSSAPSVSFYQCSILLRSSITDAI